MGVFSSSQDGRAPAFKQLRRLKLLNFCRECAYQSPTYKIILTRQFGSKTVWITSIASLLVIGCFRCGRGEGDQGEKRLKQTKAWHQSACKAAPRFKRKRRVYLGNAGSTAFDPAASRLAASLRISHASRCFVARASTPTPLSSCTSVRGVFRRPRRARAVGMAPLEGCLQPRRHGVAREVEFHPDPLLLQVHQGGGVLRRRVLQCSW